VSAARFLVSGLVQGVGFRAHARRAALRLGLRGFARNLADGRVEAAAAGPAGALDAFGLALREGPSFASVTDVQREDISDEAIPQKSFEIG
jgi:acylphosphatase